MTTVSSSSRFLIVSILAASFLTLLTNLEHTAIHYWDEGFHAMVARNLTQHPFLFTLYDQPWLPFDYKSWGNNYVWLHKPPLAMWKICISHWLLGFNTFALRFPSAILATVAVWITYRIARDLFTEKVGLIAAFMQGFNPFLFGSVHGYKYSDHIDISLLFWVEVSCWLLLKAIRTGRWQMYAYCGVAQGLAYLSKSYLALITFGVAGAVWLANRIHFLDLEKFSSAKEPPIRLKHLGIQLLASLLTIAPWTIYCLIRFPKEFLWEHKRVLDHLSTDVESWGATWDRPLFDYMILFYPVFYGVLLVAVLCLIWVMIKNRKLGEFFILAWAIGVIIPHSYALTKTPSATIIGVPPLLICLAVVIGRALDSEDWVYTSVWGATLIAINTIKGGKSLVGGRDQFDTLNAFAPYIDTNFWIVQQIALSLLVLPGIAVVYWLLSRRQWLKQIWFFARTLAIVVSLFYVGGYMESAIHVTQVNQNDSYHKVIGELIRVKFPANACFFIDDARYGSHFFLMYYANRSVYQSRYTDSEKGVAEHDLDRLVKQSTAAGAEPYLVGTMGRSYDYPVVAEGRVYDRAYTIYRLGKQQESGSD